MTRPHFWDNPEEAQELTRKRTALLQPVDRHRRLIDQADDLKVYLELAEEEGGDSLKGEIQRGLQHLEEEVAELELSVLLAGEYDHCDAILTLHPGAGGTESQDWAEMLLRMYTRWAESKDYRVEVLDWQPGDEAGVKDATISIRGENVYGFLRPERGIHRLVRISPFDSSGRRHTSFASVEVLPDLGEEAGDIDIREDDLRVDTYRATGAGGQHVNKTDSAVRITHLPTGIVVQCQNERSQHKNRAAAMTILRARLRRLREEQRRKELEEIRGEQRDIAWGNQIRSYVFHPYSLVKDHRTEVEVGNVGAVMDGAIDVFIRAYLEKEAARSVNGTAGERAE